MEQELISIIMPSYNNASYLSDAIHSVIKQTYPNWELLITDDASQDESVSIIQSHLQQDPRIKLFSLEKNSGTAAARNHSIQHAKGRYLAFLDSDDTWKPNKLEDQLAFMKNHDRAFTFTAYDLIDQKGTPTHTIVRVPDKINYSQYLGNTIIGCLTVMVDREKVGEVIVPNLKRRQDMALWLTFFKKGFSAYGINTVMASYRLNPNSLSSNKSKAVKDVWKVYREFEKIPFLKSCCYFISYAYHAVAKRI